MLFNSAWIPAGPLGYAICLGIGVLGYACALVCYRLYLSPLSRFPGPKLAAATGWYEFYFDWWCRGKFVFHVEELHKKYGPIVRVNPYELVVNDASFYNQVFVSASRRRSDLPSFFMDGMDFDDSFFLSRSHELHKIRRQPFEKYFSRTSIQGQQYMIASLAVILESRINEFKGTGKVLRLDHALPCYTADAIEAVCFGGDVISRGTLLRDPNFAPEWANSVRQMGLLSPIFCAFPWIVHCVKAIPETILLRLFPEAQVFKAFPNKAKEYIRQAKAAYEKEDLPSISLMHQIIKSDMPESEKSDQRLMKEAETLLGAATELTASTMAFGAVHILLRPDLKQRLQEELKGVMAEWPRRVPEWAELEKLPLLQGTVKESLRLIYGMIRRIARVSPDEELHYKQYVIPRGVPVGLAAYTMHTDPDVYKSPFEFDPDRWIGDVDPALRRNWVPFCRGSRACIGKHLAMSEISLILAMLFRPGGPKLQLYETGLRDVERVHDYVIGLPALDSKGIRVTVED
jgi:cytochrome P450